MIYLIVYILFMIFDLYLVLSKKVPDYFFNDAESMVSNTIFMFLPGINILLFFIFVIGIVSNEINKLYNN